MEKKDGEMIRQPSGAVRSMAAGKGAYVYETK